MSRGPNVSHSVTVTWEVGETPPRNQRVAAVTVKAMGSDGGIIFENRISPAIAVEPCSTSHLDTLHWKWPSRAAPGRRSTTEYRWLSIPNLHVTNRRRHTTGAANADCPGFAEASANANAQPVASRTFSRTERLLVRVPVYGRGDTVPAVTATLLNRRGNPMRELTQVPAELPAGVVQFDLSLASLAPDEYRVELVAANTQGPRDESQRDGRVPRDPLSRSILLLRIPFDAKDSYLRLPGGGLHHRGWRHGVEKDTSAAFSATSRSPNQRITRRGRRQRPPRSSARHTAADPGPIPEGAAARRVIIERLQTRDGSKTSKHRTASSITGSAWSSSRVRP